jgi:hypothetical protein
MMNVAMVKLSFPENPAQIKSWKQSAVPDRPFAAGILMDRPCDAKGGLFALGLNAGISVVEGFPVDVLGVRREMVSHGRGRPALAL